MNKIVIDKNIDTFYYICDMMNIMHEKITVTEDYKWLIPCVIGYEIDDNNVFKEKTILSTKANLPLDLTCFPFEYKGDARNYKEVFYTFFKSNNVIEYMIKNILDVKRDEKLEIKI